MKKRYERLGQRYGLWVGIVAILSFLVFAVLVISFWRKPALGRVTVLAVGDPMVVWSWEKSTGRFVRMTIPSRAVIDAVGGYGTYSLDALWKLGAIDKKGAAVLTESLSETLGIPIPWYIEPVSSSGTSPLRLSTVLAYLWGRAHTNMPIWTLLSLAWAGSWVRPDRVTEFTISNSNVLVDRSLADGSTVQTVDTLRLDPLLQHTFEDERIRNEHLSVAVYNTTPMPTLGNRAARLVTRIGGLVVRVGNDTPQLDRCMLKGKKEVLQSVTAVVIASLFDCDRQEGSGDIADLELRVGSVWANRFLPQKH